MREAGERVTSKRFKPGIDRVRESVCLYAIYSARNTNTK